LFGFLVTAHCFAFLSVVCLPLLGEYEERGVKSFTSTKDWIERKERGEGKIFLFVPQCDKDWIFSDGMILSAAAHTHTHALAIHTLTKLPRSRFHITE
jgi:hypothetical protein